jgi:hypothetical protein
MNVSNKPPRHLFYPEINIFLSSLCGWVAKILCFIRTTTEIITMFNVSCYWNFLMPSSLSVAPLPDRRA